MSLQPCDTYRVPEETARVAHAIFPDGNLVMRMYDELGLLFHDRGSRRIGPTAVGARPNIEVREIPLSEERY